MPRRPTRAVPTVLLTGELSAGDWPNWLANRLTEAGREVRPVTAPVEPDPGVLADPTAGLPSDGYDLIAHGVGCLLWLWHAHGDGLELPRPARVALVAPPSPTLPLDGFAGYYPVPLEIDPVRRAADGTVLVGADNDPHCPGGVAVEYGAPLKMATTVLAGAGAMTAADGYGEWPAVLDWCGRDNLAFRA